MLWANRNGYFYVLDRENGKFLSGKPFVKVNWMSGFDAKAAGRSRRRSRRACRRIPAMQGGTNWYSPSYSPRTGLFYVSAWENYGVDLSQGGQCSTSRADGSTAARARR